MCGIVGALGHHEVAPILLEALKRLEYRGYDSAGIATINNGQMDRRRAVGKLHNLSDLLVHDALPGKAGIGHTRWATHGAPNVENAHPHSAADVAVVHNGIIENFNELRLELAEFGLVPSSETDSEMVALLTQHYLSDGLSQVQAVDKTLSRLEGTFALVFLFTGQDDTFKKAWDFFELTTNFYDHVKGCITNRGHCHCTDKEWEDATNKHAAKNHRVIDRKNEIRVTIADLGNIGTD